MKRPARAKLDQLIRDTPDPVTGRRGLAEWAPLVNAVQAASAEALAAREVRYRAEQAEHARRAKVVHDAEAAANALARQWLEDGVRDWVSGRKGH